MMNNVYWHILQLISFLLPCSFLILKVFESRLRVSKTQYWVNAIAMIIFASAVITISITEISPYRQFSALGISVIMVAVMSVLLSTFKNIGTSIVFISFVFLNIQYNSFILAQATIDFGFIPNMGLYENIDLLIVATIYNYIMLISMYYILVKTYKKIIEADMISHSSWFLFTLPMGMFVTICLLMTVILSYTGTATKELFVPVAIMNVCMFATYYSVLSTISAAYSATVSKEMAKTMRAQIALWQQQYDSLQMKIDLDAKSRHDWKHHIISVIDYVDRGDAEGLKYYLSDYRKKYLVSDWDSPLCDISALNTMFIYYKHRASETGIDMTISKNSFADCHVTPPDLTVLFGNLLENAIEACNRMTKGRKYISLKIDSSVPGMLAVICENSFDGVEFDDSGQVKSCKANGGIGLYSIKSIAEKYGGSVEKKIQGNVFKIYVSLQK